MRYVLWKIKSLTSALKRVHRPIVHKIIMRYLLKCGGAFHVGPYGNDGRYIVLMNDNQYHEYTWKVEEP